MYNKKVADNICNAFNNGRGGIYKYASYNYHHQELSRTSYEFSDQKIIEN